MIKKKHHSILLSKDAYIIPQSTMNEMMDQIHKTHKTGKEHGMSLCTRDREVIPGNKSIGTERGIYISETCANKKDTFVGSFHTHPDDSEAAASAADLFSSCLRINNLDCVGKNSKGEIVCYDKKKKGKVCTNEAEPLLDIENAFYDTPSGDLPNLKKELYNEVDKVADKHFTKIRIK
jgi:proteasome lid subunit RPN8/RPN11